MLHTFSILALAAVLPAATTPVHVSADGFSPTSVTAAAGSACTFGPYRYGAVGAVLLGGPDKPGRAGNEIDNIYRVFYTLPATSGGKAVTGFAGWLASSFDGRFVFTPAVLPNENPPTQIGNAALAVVPTQPERLPVGQWLADLARRTGEAPPAELTALLDARGITTAVSPCFAQAWDGRTS